MDLRTVDLDPLGNKLLAGLPREEFARLKPYLTTGPLTQGSVLAEPGDEVDRVVFPLTGMISLVLVMKDGRAIETATVGRNGVFGAAAAFSLYRSKVRAIVQIEMTGGFIPAAQFRKAAAASRAIQLMCIEYNEALLAQARVTAACNALHTVEARFCRWLLQTSRVTNSDTITLTQEFLSEMLGVRRTSVTEVAGKMQGAGVISYARGVIKILDRTALDARSCECLQMLTEQKVL